MSLFFSFLIIFLLLLLLLLFWSNYYVFDTFHLAELILAQREESDPYNLNWPNPPHLGSALGSSAFDLIRPNWEFLSFNWGLHQEVQPFFKLAFPPPPPPCAHKKWMDPLDDRTERFQVRLEKSWLSNRSGSTCTYCEEMNEISIYQHHHRCTTCDGRKVPGDGNS